MILPLEEDRNLNRIIHDARQQELVQIVAHYSYRYIFYTR